MASREMSRRAEMWGWRGWLGWAAGTLGLMAAAAAVLFWPQRQLSAAEILDRANRAWGAVPQAGDVIYQKFELMINVGPVNYAAWVSLWRSPDGQQVRYEMRDAQGRLIYFMLRSGNQVWRSGGLDTLSLAAVNTVFPETLAQYQQELAAQQPSSGQGPAGMLQLAAGVDRPLVKGAGPPVKGASPTVDEQVCLELKCFLGDWSAEKGVTYIRQTDAATASGAMGPTVRMTFEGNPASGEAAGWCILVVDPQTYRLAEFIDPTGNMLHVLDTLSLPASDLPPDLFSGFPPGVNAVG